MNNSQQSPTPEELKNLESDTVWSLLDEASQQNASPMFTDNVMNEIRSTSQELPDNVVTVPSFWKRYSLPISAAAIAGVAACVMITLSSGDPKPGNSGEIVDTEIEFSDADLAFFEDEMTFDEQATATTETDVLDQMIAIDNEDPFFMTAEDIDILVSM